MSQENATRGASSPRAARRKSSLQAVHPNAAGIDIGSRAHFVAVPEDRSPRPVQMFGAFTNELLRLASWLKECGIETVAMESTGSYWVPLYEILEAQGFDVFLVNAKHLSRVPGRKTDVQDCQWIQTCHQFGFLSKSFRPVAEIVELRAHVRHRQNLVEAASKTVLHMQAALLGMNVQLDTVVSDITGVTGMSILRAILAGERDPQALARFRDPACHASSATIAQALIGSWRPEYLFQLRQAIESYDFLHRQMRECDELIDEILKRLAQQAPDRQTPIPSPRTRFKARRNEPRIEIREPLYQIVGVDLTQTIGIDRFQALKILSEVGHDMTPWPTEKHFTSWLRLAPGNNISGGKRRRVKRSSAPQRAGQLFRISAMTLTRSDSALGAFYRRLASRIGAVKAITATARKLALLVYRLLRYGDGYQPMTASDYETMHKSRIFASLKRRARSLGYELTKIDQSTSPATEVP